MTHYELIPISYAADYVYDFLLLFYTIYTLCNLKFFILTVVVVGFLCFVLSSCHHSGLWHCKKAKMFVRKRKEWTRRQDTGNLT